MPPDSVSEPTPEPPSSPTGEGRDGAGRPSAPLAPRPWRRLAWLALPVLAGLAVVVAGAVRTRVASTTAADPWRSLDPWLPTVLPARAGYAVDPWPVLLTAGTVLTVALTAAAMTVLVLGVRRRSLRFALLWLAVVVAGVVAVGASQLGEVLHVVELFGGRGGSQIRTFTLPALEVAVRWGLLWGLLPALVTALLLPPADADADSGERGSRRRRPRTLLALALLLAAVGSGASLTSSARGASVSTMTEVAQPEPTEDPGPTDPPDLVAPSTAPSVDGLCAEADLATTVAYTDAATGRRFGVATTTNTGTTACTVVGLPDLAFADADGNAVEPAIEPWGGFQSGGIPGDDVLEPVALDIPVLLEPGASATAELTWRGTGAGATTVEQVLVAPWPGAARTVVDEWLDVSTGDPLGVSPWVAAELPTNG